ncbi:MAG: hypothetical protein ABJO54_01295 [Hyphomicrobiales bacterium]
MSDTPQIIEVRTSSGGLSSVVIAGLFLIAGALLSNLPQLQDRYFPQLPQIVDHDIDMKRSDSFFILDGSIRLQVQAVASKPRRISFTLYDVRTNKPLEGYKANNMEDGIGQGSVKKVSHNGKLYAILVKRITPGSDIAQSAMLSISRLE